MKTILFLIITILLFLSGCTQSTQAENPDWISTLIRQFESNPVTNPPLSIWRYEYNGQTVYFIPPYCCDIPGSLFDEDGYLICYPDGGIKGDGDGRCTDFFNQRTNEQLIWQDTRIR